MLLNVGIAKPVAGRTTVYGVYKGMGDLLAALPVILADIQKGNKAILVVFPQLVPLIELLELDQARQHLCVATIPRRVRDISSFVSLLRQQAPSFFWVSPHAPLAARGWKASALMWVLKVLAGRKGALLAGARSERLSRLFDLRIPVDRTLPFAQREREAFSAARNCPDLLNTPRVNFRQDAIKHTSEENRLDVAIFPGASAKNRKWPLAYYEELVRLLPEKLQLGLIVQSDDALALRQLPLDRINVRLVQGNLGDAISAIAQARLVLCMESGPMFFAQTLGVKAIALFGVSDPNSVISGVIPIYEPRWPCQPCYRTQCRYQQNYCLTSVTPERVANKVVETLTNMAPAN